MTRLFTPRVSPPDLPQVHLSPGQLLVTHEARLVATVLGSCVAVTMFDRHSRLAAICHAMLAEPQETVQLGAGDPARFRYMVHALPAMIGAFRRAGVPPRTIEVKLFGGANVIGEQHSADPHWIGGATLTVARQLLERATLGIAAENTGGQHGRKILFNTVTGEVLHKHLKTIRR